MDLATFFLSALAIVTVILTAIFYWMMNKRNATLRFVALIFAVLTLGLGGIFWYVIQDSIIFIACFGITISQSLFILSLPRIAPALFKKLEKNLGIRW